MIDVKISSSDEMEPKDWVEALRNVRRAFLCVHDGDGLDPIAQDEMLSMAAFLDLAMHSASRAASIQARAVADRRLGR